MKYGQDRAIIRYQMSEQARVRKSDLKPTDQVDMSTWPGPSKAGRELGISAHMVKVLAKQGHLASARTGIGIVINPESIEAERARRLARSRA
jgi:hypothetical protein